MIVVACPACRQKLKVSDDLLGKRVKCPGCGRAIVAPATGAGRPAPVAVPVKVPPSPGPRPAVENDRILPPKASVGQQPAADSSSGEDTDAGLLANPDSDRSAELTDFLAPPQGPGEIGQLGPYRILAVLGRGGMGVVFRAEDPQLRRPVALKAMLPSLATSPKARERFFREARAAAALKHPNVVTIFQVGEDRNAPFLAMEFLEGESLEQRLQREGRLPVAEVLRIGGEIARGLAAAHERGLVHRDVKPANIWLEGKEGHVKILDFGLARSLADETHLTHSGAILGTPAYMAPEQAMGHKVDHRCDLFSLGCVLYRMATGQLPFQGSDALAILSALAMDNPKTPREVNPAVPEALSEVVMRLLAKKPEDRPATAQEVAATLAAQGNDHTALLTPLSEPLPAPRPAATTARRRRRALVLALAAVVLVGVVAVVWMASRKGGPGVAGVPSASQSGGAEPADAQRVALEPERADKGAAKTGVPGPKEPQTPPKEKDDCPVPVEKWKGDYTEKTWGVKIKTVKSSGTAGLNVVLEFTRDLKPDELQALKEALTQTTLAGSGRYASVVPAPGRLEFCFFDEDGVMMTKVRNYVVVGSLTGVKGDAFRCSLSIQRENAFNGVLLSPEEIKRISRGEIRPPKQ
jgi:serine/threonine protein kinase